VVLKQKYTRNSVSFLEVFPKEVRKQPTIDYILERTLRRPRDVILFINEAFKVASGRVEMTPSLVQTAYRSYSFGRKVSMLEEWNDIYPDLDLHIELLSGLKSRTQVREFSVESYNALALKYIVREDGIDPVTAEVIALANRKGDVPSIYDALPALRKLLECAYVVGAIGFISPPSSSVRWSGNQMDQFSSSSIDLDTIVVIHPMLAEALGVNTTPVHPV